MRIAIDTGGTFTDCVYLDDGEFRVFKLPSTPHDPSAAVLAAVQHIARDRRAEVRHGTTVGTNALLERKGARVAFVTTAGFEDTIVIGRQARPELYNWFWQPEPPLAPEGMRFGAAERTGPDGTILRAIDEAELARLHDAIAAVKPEAIAVSLLFSFANPANEQAIGRALGDLGVPVSLSHRILPEFREYERGSTVLINAYLAPKMQGYVDRLNEELEAKRSQLDVMQSSGGIISAGTASREPVRTVLSGPAGGVVGALALAKMAGFPRVLTFDMGGTSTDVALVDSELGLRTTTESRVLGMPVAVPMLNIHTVGAGGGSLASFDRGGALKVGPESAGADPGPICYGRGEQPTVTDANLVLGRFATTGLLGGEMPLHEKRTRDIFESAKGQIETVEQFAEGITRVVNAHMEKALRKISVEYGYDPRDFVLLSFGGAGPLHACALARALNVPKVLVPRIPGALSAYGVFVSDAVRDYSRTVMLPPTDPQLPKHFEDLEQLSLHESTDSQSSRNFRSVDLRYVGQGYEISVDWDGDPTEHFHREHERRYGYADRKRQVEAVTIRLRSVLTSETPAVREHTKVGSDAHEAVLGEKQIYSDGGWLAGLVYQREQLRAGDGVTGPAIVTEYSATTFVPAGCRVEVDRFLNMVIDVCAN